MSGDWAKNEADRREGNNDLVSVRGGFGGLAFVEFVLGAIEVVEERVGLGG